MKRFLIIITLLLPTTIFGAQRIAIKEGSTIKIPVSIHDLNHIAVEDDRILTVKGSSGQFQLDKDEILGQLYIQPQPEIKDPIHLFLTTEKQRILSLSLVPSDRPSESIILVLDNDKKLAAHFEQSQPYEQVLISLIKAMHSQAPLEGYSIETINLKNKGPKGLEILHCQSYRGEALRGEVLQISNRKKEPVTLLESDFYKSSVRAVSLSSQLISPYSKIMVYLVRDNG